MSVIHDLLSRRRPRTAFVLGGGGNLGAVQVGMLRALLERGVFPDAVIGCSVGGLNAAGIAGDPSLEEVDRMAQLWKGLSGQDIFPPSRLTGPWQLVMRGESIYANDGLREVILRWLRYSDFEDSAVPLHIVATAMRDQRDRWFTSGPVVEPLLASASLPAIFPPVWIDGEAYIDGGVVNNVPVSRALALGAEKIYVLHVGNFDRARGRPRRPLDVLIQAFSIARTYRFRVDLDEIPPGVEMITLPGVDPGPLRYNDFSRSAELIERGYASTASFLDARVAVG